MALLPDGPGARCPSAAAAAAVPVSGGGDGSTSSIYKFGFVFYRANNVENILL